MKYPVNYTEWAYRELLYEYERVLSQRAELLQELKNIANAPSKNFLDDTDFKAWAQNRARAAIATAEGRS
jgi:hypothetical protein